MNRSSGEPAGDPQIWRGDSPAVTLGWVNSNSESTLSGSSRFRIYTPDSRLRVKVSLLFLRDDPTDTRPVTLLASRLYLGEEEHDFSGKTGAELICTDILRDVSGNVIHQAAPMAIPENVGLDGFTMEFVTAADSVIGIFTTSNAAAGPAGHWVLQVRFQPDGQRLCPEDWDWIKRKCHATRIGEEFFLS